MATDEPRAVNRRWMLSTIGVGTAVGIAGCLSDDPGDGQPENGEPEDDDTDNGEDDGTEDEDELDVEPAEFPEDRECAVCSMVAAEYPDWNAQLVHDDEHREYFCTSGCMSAYYVDPERFDGSDAEIVGVWVTEYENRDLVDAADVYFVRVTDTDHVDDPMRRNPTPFADRESAVAFTEDFDEYDDDDVLTLDDFDLDLATLYRQRAFEDDDDDGHDHDDDDDGHDDH